MYIYCLMEQMRFLYIKSIKKSKWGARFHHPYRSACRDYQKVIRKNHITQLVIGKNVLRKLLDSGELDELIYGVEWIQESQLAFRFVPFLLEKAYVRYAIAKKDVKPVVLDKEEIKEHTISVLSRIYKDLNYLAVVTKRADYFMEFADEVYEETGLPIRLTESIPAEANVLIDLRQLSREKCSYTIEGHPVEPDMLQALLTGTDVGNNGRFDINCTADLKHFPKRIGK